MDESDVGVTLQQRGWRAAFTVEERAEAWSWLVTEVEKGYHDEVDEYTSDLYCRNWLHEAWLLLDDQVVLRWTDRIRNLDNRFRAATINDDGYVLSQFHYFDDPDLWWWRRYPRILVGELGRQLRSAGATE
ncbi:hypothetical protein [Pilimelia columellifera]|uniref:Uncharacterized protein n=1 Tax=Pilimelia columellifera subsp. columellifera TaxID=706583 RepID=A0ABN3NJV1_9ACTN